jgi:choline transport protein
MVVHIMAFFATTVVIWTFAPHPPARAVILSLVDSGGWPDMTVSLMVGQVCAIASLGCKFYQSYHRRCKLCPPVADQLHRLRLRIAHVRRSPGCRPFRPTRNDLVASHQRHNGSHLRLHIRILRPIHQRSAARPLRLRLHVDLPNSPGKRQPGRDILTTAVVFVLMSGNLAYTAVSARQIWSFARDEGLPCSAWLGKTSPTSAVPINATLVTLGCTVLLSLINLVSTAALNAILSLQLSAMLATYAVCLACVSTAKYFRPSTVPQARWSLGRYGLPINVLATLYATFACFWTFWPDHAKVHVSNMNWAPVILGGVMLVASGLYFSQARRSYYGPVLLVKR